MSSFTAEIRRSRRDLKLMNIWLDIDSVTENGFAVKDENTMSLEEALEDEPRVNYYRGVTESLIKAIVEDGVDIRAYFAWSESFPLPSASL